MLTSDHLIERLRLEVEQTSRVDVGKRLGFTPAFIGRVVAGEERISKRLAEAMGYRRVDRFEPINGR